MFARSNCDPFIALSSPCGKLPHRHLRRTLGVPRHPLLGHRSSAASRIFLNSGLGALRPRERLCLVPCRRSRASVFAAIPVPEPQAKLRQSSCPNHHLAKFLSSTQACGSPDSRYVNQSLSKSCAAPVLKQTRRDPAPRAPKSATKLRINPSEGAPRREKRKRAAIGGSDRSVSTMKFFTGCVAAAALVLAASAGHAQVPASGIARGAVIAVSDFDAPYAPEAVPPSPRYGYGYGYEERSPALVLLPSTEVYAVLRENGFLPLGIPRLRGSVYTIAVIDRRGDDGRLVIDARDGRIIRFMPAADAYGMAPAYDERAVAPYGPQSALPPPTAIRSGPPRPPAPIPHVASRAVPLPKAAPRRAETPVAAAKPAAPVAQQAQAPQAQPSQQAAAVQAKPAEAAAPTIGQANPAATILPTQEMPAVQGLD
ncbi:hypothetical protein EHH60_31580 [Bradyrhizobium sp. RP6]|nr:hypothetical protein EHH60_31580 [Bradyrhizobium sp. RP6]